CPGYRRAPERSRGVAATLNVSPTWLAPWEVLRRYGARPALPGPSRRRWLPPVLRAIRALPSPPHGLPSRTRLHARELGATAGEWGEGKERGAGRRLPPRK